jgi:hypothetical protein
MCRVMCRVCVGCVRGQKDPSHRSSPDKHRDSGRRCEGWDKNVMVERASLLGNGVGMIAVGKKGRNSEMKINGDLFCNSLVFHYLCNIKLKSFNEWKSY